MTDLSLTFDAVAEAAPGPKWQQRWHRSWPDYQAWFMARGGDHGPDRTDCRAAIAGHMPEVLATYDRLVALAGGSDRAARFLSMWCPPAYLGGCSLAALANQEDVRLVRNYDLSPDLNEGLLLRSAWCRPVMGMVEFLWGLSDGINDAGLSIALAYGGHSETGAGFGVTLILRYVLETCDTVDQALRVLARVPSHMAYNLVLADASGATAGVELHPGGGMHRLADAIATNHQRGGTGPARPDFTRTFERHRHLAALKVAPDQLAGHFATPPLVQDRYAEGFGTLFTAEYAPKKAAMVLIWPGQRWSQSLADFEEGQRRIDFAQAPAPRAARDGQDHARPVDWSLAAQIDWGAVARDYANGRGRAIADYLPACPTRWPDRPPGRSDSLQTASFKP